VKHVVVAAAWKERLTGKHFNENTADGPDVDFVSVLGSYQLLGSAVPPSACVVLHLILAKSSGAKITNFEDVVLTEEHVLGLVVPVSNIKTVHVLRRF
jgi:hypothetical protein